LMLLVAKLLVSPVRGSVTVAVKDPHDP